ncbi:hypothetical protein [Streptomyces sp. NPDC006193]|uniref:hypothetical protein n=1 Tax=Streptomyces sp. NPDC006193 TaxID=3155717 RepID=UPI0033BD5568
MTQSGQGEEPSARTAREGIVLPSDGGEPLLPGTTGAAAPAAPAGGRSWGGSWSPEQQPQQQGQDWPGANPGPLPPEGAAAPAYGDGAPSYGGEPPAHGPGGRGGRHGAPQQPPYPSGPYQQDQQQYQHHDQHHDQQQYPARAPLPPTADGATQYLPPVPAGPADEGATQYLPPVQAAPDEGATQYLPPVQAAPGDEGATQYLPPVTPGALPPESADEQTRYLGHAPRQGAPAPSDAEATQYIPPYAAQAQDGERQPPAEFDNLFRGGPAGGDGPAGSTQQLPRVQQPDARPGPAQASHRPAAQPSYGPRDDGRRPRDGRSRVPLIAAVGVGLAVLGVGAGVLLNGVGGKDETGEDKPAAASPAPQDSASAADPARQQAVELDKLLADSGSSRATVIRAVTDVRRCDNLDQAAADLRDAARQRSELVTRLGKLSVDRLPAHDGLTSALTRAWQASAAADNHYAAWADQVKGRKGCHKGHARTTGETQAGNRESGTASAQKVQAAALWNTIAQQYGLTRRKPTEL